MLLQPAVWFPAIRTGTGTDNFTERLATALCKRGIRAEITWLPHYAEFAPWFLRKPKPPVWATVVHCNSWFYKRLLPNNLPLVVTLHSCVHDPAFEPYKSFAQKLYHNQWVRRLERYAIHHADAVTAVSRYTANRGTAVFGRSDIKTIYNWIDTDVFHPGDRQEPGKPFQLLFVGNPSSRKGFDLLPKIMHCLGDEYVLSYTGQAQDIGAQVLPANMIPLGWLQGDLALANAYQNSDALLFPTRLEGFGLCVVEAQACGLPVISTYSSSIPEVVEAGKTALLCPVDDVDAFVAATKQLKQNSGFRKNMSENAVLRARQFSEDTAVRQYLEIYHALTGYSDLSKRSQQA